MHRREFGIRLLKVSAALGAQTIGQRLGLGLGLGVGASLAACGHDEPVISSDRSPVIIVGSGYGASVAALRLTERGIAVTMIEAGRLWNEPGPDGLVFCNSAKPDGRAMWFRTQTVGPIKQFMGIDTALNVRVADAEVRRVGIEPFFLESGYDYKYMEQEAQDLVPKSALNSEGGYGNNYGKLSLDKTYLAEALGTGLLTILPLHVVKRIERNAGGEYVVSCDQIDVDGNVLAQKQLSCRRLFLGAGSVGTSELLLRARDTGALSDLNDHIGTGWGPNSDIFVARTQPDSVLTGDKISMVPATGFRYMDQNGRPVFSMAIPFPAGFETHISFAIGMAESREAGSFRYDATSDSVELVWDASQQEPAVASVRQLFDQLNQLRGSTYRTEFFGGQEFGTRSTFHALGGCPLGQATDLYGRVIGYKGLYITDGSLIPVTLGANPSLTITALAERNLERIVAEDFRA